MIPFHLADLGCSLIFQKDAFLCAIKDGTVGLRFQKRIMAGLFKGEGGIMNRFEGDGFAFIHVGSTIVRSNWLTARNWTLIPAA